MLFLILTTAYKNALTVSIIFVLRFGLQTSGSPTSDFPYLLSTIVQKKTRKVLFLSALI
jgi:hypothetical protein